MCKGYQQTHGLLRLEKYLNIQDCLENKICLEKNLKALKVLEKSLNFTLCKRIQHCFRRPKSVYNCDAFI